MNCETCKNYHPTKCLVELPCAIGCRSLPFGTINLQKVLWCFELVALLSLLNCYTQSSIHFSPSEGFNSQNFSSFCGHVLLVKSASQLNSQQKTQGPLVAGDAYRIRRITGPTKTFTPGDFNIFLVEVCFPTY